MADGKVEIDVGLNTKSAKSDASKLGKNLESAIKSGTKSADKSLDGISSKFGKTFREGATQAKDAMGTVGSSAREMGADVGSASDSAGSKLGDIAKKALAVVASMEAIKAAAGFIMDSVNAYASYEQLVGGVETLFGAGGKSVEEYAASVGKSVDEVSGKYDELMAAQDRVMADAADAYKTAGVSANTYMEQATSFSASLVSSLGGDTVKAAEYANKAIVDMSDNANKMGTDIGMIQNAYQGFAKQNYTMLDNLKLGYGGTKTEMERLIADANKLAEANGQAADLSIDSYADVIEAIHLVQENMGITGTTALEAATTIEGSINMAKASYENFIVGLADDNADITELSSQLVESIITAANNLLPRISEAVSSAARVLVNVLPQLLGSLSESVLPMVMDIATAIITAIPAIINAGIQLIGALAIGILEALPGMLETISQSFVESIPYLVETFMTVITGLVEALPTIISALVEAMPTVIMALVDALVASIDALIQGFIQLFNALIVALPEIIIALVGAIPTIVNALVTALVENLPILVQGFIQLFMAFVTALPQIIAVIVPLIPTIVTQIVSTLLQNLPLLISAAIQLFVAFAGGILQAIPQIIATLGQMGMDMLSKIGELPGQLISKGGDIINGLWEGISGAIGGFISNIQGFCNDIMGTITGFFGIHSPSTLMRDMVGKNLAEGIAVGFEENNPIDDMVKSLDGSVEALSEAASNMAVEIPANTEEQEEVGQLTVETYTNAIEDEAGDANESGQLMAKEVTGGMSGGVNDAGRVGTNTSEAYIREINRADASPAARRLKDSAINELKSGESEAYNAGVMLGNGFINGMDSTLSRVIEKARQLAREAVEAIKKEGQQGSPWKTTIECGEFAGEGLAIGFERANPMAQIADMVRSGLSTLSLSAQAQAAGANITTNNQTLNFNQPVQSPDEISRAMRMQQHYGLAGRF